MVKLASGHERKELRVGVGQRALGSASSRLRAAATTLGKLAFAYAAWILLAYGLGGYASTPQFGQFAAIAYWFGWLFVAATAFFVVAATAVGVFNDVRA